jgi:flagellar basal-body rod protein FlgF
LDLAAGDKLYFGVKTNDQNAVAFTRDGRLSLDVNGVLKAAGFPLVGQNGQPIVLPPNVTPEIDASGRVLVQGEEINRLQMFKIDGRVDRAGPSLLVPAAGSVVTPQDAQVKSGMLEGSNAPPLESMVSMISAQRNYEMSMQALQTYRRMDDSANNVGRVR